MKKSFGKKIVEQYRANGKLELLQYAYLILFAVVTMAAGLVALIHQAVGVAFLIIPLICLVTWSMNLIAWSVVKTAVEHFYPEVLKPEVIKIPKAKRAVNTQKATTASRVARAQKTASTERVARTQKISSTEKVASTQKTTDVKPARTKSASKKKK
mgnify:CR=1 FL=1